MTLKPNSKIQTLMSERSGVLTNIITISKEQFKKKNWKSKFKVKNLIQITNKLLNGKLASLKIFR